MPKDARHPAPGPRVVKVRAELFKPGYVVRDEVWEHAGEQTPLLAAYTPAGAYIGTPDDAEFLCVKKGIAPEGRESQHTVCSIGFCDRERQWYGWSHRAIFGFGVGHAVKPGDVAADQFPVGFVVQTLDDARRLACAFAEGVS